MSRTKCAGSLPDNIQLIQTNSSTINNRISEQDNHLIQFTDETTFNDTIQTNINNIKQQQQQQQRKSSSKRSIGIFYFIKQNKFFFLEKNCKFLKKETEMIINETDGKKQRKTSETICDTSSRMTGLVSPYSSSYSTSYRSEKEQRSISDPRRSLQAFSSRINTSNKSHHRRSTVVCVPLSDQEQDKNNINEIILRVPYKKIQEENFNQNRSDHSIALIKENSSYPIDEPKEHFYYSNSDSDQQKYYQKNTTRIKLSLPITSTNKISRHQNIIHGNNKDITGEFTLPTNPPITVTIEPQNNLNINIDKDNSIHDDQICSPEHVNNNNIIQEQRTSIDPSIKGGSTIVSYFMDLLKPSDNKLAMKLFGSRKGVLKERLRQQRAGHCIIHPCSNFRLEFIFYFI